ncbi:hypothetical protein [Jannaschia aquimarina]|uniref:Lipoprotein n=1 Tax=Jannaschia aquimarina TaxID=935700 RepID=A0A0D1EP79_9RHOB|nr:hypothetical protein [Jannaschia aquimarina]KIT17470.1 hypothetical protein jaqu_06580 [Jannaschia aquimarina]SNS75238.1 hypothetical protein SAMN05421775_102152 [Jannaschia aquimarina]
MSRIALVPVLVILAACNPVTAGNPSVEQALALAADRTCPLPVPERDSLLAAAVAADDATPVEAFLAQRPEDATAQATAQLIAGEPVVDPDRIACLSPYL